MKRHEMAILAFKVLAVYIAVGAIGSIESLISNWYFFPKDQRGQAMILSLLPIGISVGIGLLIWISAESLACRVFPDSSASTDLNGLKHPTEELLEIAFTVIGLWLIVYSLPALIDWIALYLFSVIGRRSVMGGYGALTAEQSEELFSLRAKASIVSFAAKLTIGSALLLGPRACINFVKKLRNVIGLSPTAAGEEEPEHAETDSDSLQNDEATQQGAAAERPPDGR